MKHSRDTEGRLTLITGQIKNKRDDAVAARTDTHTCTHIYRMCAQYRRRQCGRDRGLTDLVNTP